MTIHEAARRLWDELADEPWLTTIGVGRDREQDCIYVYVNSTRADVRSKVASEWQGYPVIVTKLGALRPLGMSASQ